MEAWNHTHTHGFLELWRPWGFSHEARRGSQGASRAAPGVSGNFWGSQEGCQGPFRTSGLNRGLPLRRRRGQGPHLAKTWEPRCFSRVAAGFSSYDGDLRLPLGLALGSPIFPSGCEGRFSGPSATLTSFRKPSLPPVPELLTSHNWAPGSKLRAPCRNRVLTGVLDSVCMGR